MNRPYRLIGVTNRVEFSVVAYAQINRFGAGEYIAKL